MVNLTELSTQSVLAVFAEEVQGLGGQVKDVFDDGTRLLARSVLPAMREVGPHDPIQGGVAVRCTSCDLSVHPYTLRKVCKNGAVMARAHQSWRIEYFEVRMPESVLAEVRQAVTVCAGEEAFGASATAMQSARLDMELTLLEHFGRSSLARRHLREIMGRFVEAGDRSRFGLMNAVTSLARDTSDLQDKWDLEELGGAIAMAPVTSRPGPVPSRVCVGV
jgi:hypothetical protein